MLGLLTRSGDRNIMGLIVVSVRKLGNMNATNYEWCFKFTVRIFVTGTRNNEQGVRIRHACQGKNIIGIFKGGFITSPTVYGFFMRTLH